MTSPTAAIPSGTDAPGHAFALAAPIVPLRSLLALTRLDQRISQVDLTRKEPQPQTEAFRDPALFD